MTMHLTSVLIANRGEIAVRVIRSAQEMGLRTIAVYSELDRDALHVRLADESWNIGGAPASESYLNIDTILEVAMEAKADAVHPGYGFLAENADFAQAVIDAGMVWVGPPPSAIRVMGDKIASRVAVNAANVLSVPGTLEPLNNANEIKAVAHKFGYPVAIKAAHGGGGKGLRIVYSDDELEDAFQGAKREADAYFGNASVYVEKYLEKPRHIEAQIFCDNKGRGWYLGDRDCSVQRRHQKLIEEAPSTALSNAQRKKLSKAALAVAASCDYRNAGTVEFLLDQNGELYFLEMNTRLQVEHTVTELTTGIDLVQEQLRCAGGIPSSFGTVKQYGHAIEFRINAEDPGNNFLPSPGTVVDYREPSGFGVRVDSWIEAGTTVTQFYDNLMGKLIVWGRTRDEAIRRGKRALSEFTITGVATTIGAHLAVLDHPVFLAGKHHTRFMEEDVDLSHLRTDPGASLPTEVATTQRAMSVEIGGRRFDVKYWAPEAGPVETTLQQPKPRKSGPKASGEPGVITAPMQGTIVKVAVESGEIVEQNDTICVLEAMKMENEVTAPIAGNVIELRVRAGDTVTPGQVLAIVR